MCKFYKLLCMCSGWYNNWVTWQHARCNNKNINGIVFFLICFERRAEELTRMSVYNVWRNRPKVTSAHICLTTRSVGVCSALRTGNCAFCEHKSSARKAPDYWLTDSNNWQLTAAQYTRSAEGLRLDKQKIMSRTINCLMQRRAKRYLTL